MTIAIRIALCLLLALAPLDAWAQSDDKAMMIVSDDAEMAAAIEKARSGLDEFLALSDAPLPGTDKFKLKVMIVDGNATEHFWVIPFKRTDTGLVGILANEPEIVRNVVLGQNIEFTRDDISDWGYTKNGHQVGSFTVCVMLKKMSKEEADNLRSAYGFDC
ncbi:YegJ family protein [Mesorhizobium sp. RIZ17]|uniref:YegJ family protein n=1 Tax=Mesorhizobium sp. RIZ17 TaxID=3132743 RepID=UPI003DA9B448